MNIATMKVHGDDDALADVRDGLPTEPDSDWQKGDVKPDGRVRIDSGFYVGIGTEEDPDEHCSSRSATTWPNARRAASTSNARTSPPNCASRSPPSVARRRPAWTSRWPI